MHPLNSATFLISTFIISYTTVQGFEMTDISLDGAHRSALHFVVFIVYLMTKLMI